MRYLITGAAGFVGSHLSARLSQSGGEVLGLDDFNSYYSPSLKELRVSHLLAPLGIEVKRIDLSNLQSVRDVISKFKPDYVLHLAARPGVRTPLDQSHHYIRDNIVAYCNVLQASIEENVPDFLYASSSSVYGNSQRNSYSEDDLSIRPISIYGSTKLSNEVLATTFVNGSNTRARGMRFFTVYGPWGRPDMAYFRIINALVNGSTFKKFGDGEVKRDFTYIDDITDAIERLCKDLNSHPAGFSDIVNIGGGSPHSLNDLIKIIAKQLNMIPQIEKFNQDSNDMSFTSADVGRLKEITKSIPHTSLEQGIGHTVEWATQTGISELLNEWVHSSN